MSVVTPSSEDNGDSIARYFVVEVKSGANPVYVVCERIANFSPGSDGIPPGLVERRIAARPLRAATLSTSGSGDDAELSRMLGITVVFAGQSGRPGFGSQSGQTGVNVNLTVNQNNPPSK